MCDVFLPCRPILLEVPHQASMRNGEREVYVLRSDNGTTWHEQPLASADSDINEALDGCFSGGWSSFFASIIRVIIPELRVHINLRNILRYPISRSVLAGSTQSKLTWSDGIFHQNLDHFVVPEITNFDRSRILRVGQWF